MKRFWLCKIFAFSWIQAHLSISNWFSTRTSHKIVSFTFYIYQSLGRDRHFIGSINVCKQSSRKASDNCCKHWRRFILFNAKKKKVNCLFGESWENWKIIIGFNGLRRTLILTQSFIRWAIENERKIDSIDLRK